MMRTRKWLIGILGGAVACTGVSQGRAGDEIVNTYQGIVERNVFALKPAPEPAPPGPVKGPTPKIFLTGITTLGGNKRALLKTTPAAKPGEAAKEHSYMLAEGERQDDLEVLAVDEINGVVKVNYAGDVVSVNFKDNAVASANPQPGAAPGAPGAPGQPAMPHPGAGAPAPTGVFRPPAAPAPGAGPVSANNAPVGAGAVGAAAEPPLTAEQQAMLIELNREALKTEDPSAPPFPPTMLTEGLNAAMEEESAAGAPGAPGSTGRTTGAKLPIPGRPGLTSPF